MPTIKALKAELKKLTDKNPEKFYPVSVLKDAGFHREKCKNCGTYFWTTVDSKVCGEAECRGGYSFIGDSPTKKRMDFIETWKEYAKLFKKLGYTPIKRYPVVARWRDDVYWTNASIYDFQPYVVSGEIEPPANPLVVPQACVRFNDIDNVGITGRHFTGFVMIGQHAFLPKEEFDQGRFFSDKLKWLTDGMGLPLHEIVFHEDQWGGGGNLGVSMEFFSRGLEIGNQVYMNYSVTPTGYKDLNLKVLDMGMGQERPAWLSHGTETSYEANFPPVVKKLYKDTGLKPDQSVWRRFLPYSGLLDMEEADDIEKVWGSIAEKVGMQKDALKKEILPLAALYSIGDHTRTLLWAISDGALPSNVGGCYNLRLLLRRCFSFIDSHGWDLDLVDVCREHAKYLKPQYPEMAGHVDKLNDIFAIERKRYEKTKEKSRRVVEQVAKKNISDSLLLELYDSQGIPPEIIKEEAKKHGKELKIPEDFYSKVAALHPEVEVKKAAAAEKEFAGLPKTEALFYDDWRAVEFTAKILKAKGKKVVLDKTAFYATKGGQDHDTGTLNGIKVEDVTAEGNVIIHHLEKSLKGGDSVKGKVDLDRRAALVKHHTAAHIVGGAARRVLGDHVWQAGSQIHTTKGRLDITHFDSLTKEQVTEIESLSNKVIKENHKVHKNFIPKVEAEKKHGFVLYQGGAVPGKEIRVVRIEDWDVQACGGIHLNSTGEAEGIRLVKTERIQDGAVRLVFIAGKEMLTQKEEKEEGILGDSLKAFKDAGITVKSGDIGPAANVFSVGKKQLPSTLKRFLNETKDAFAGIKKEGGTASFDALCKKLGGKSLESASKMLFEEWKVIKKQLTFLTETKMAGKSAELLKTKEKFTGFSLVTAEFKDFGEGMRLMNKITAENPDILMLITSKNRAACGVGNDVKRSAQETLNTLAPNSKISGSDRRAVSDKPLKDLKKAKKKLSSA